LPSLLLTCALAGVLLAPRAIAQTNVTTYHYDNSRTGQNTSETLLTPSNVNATQFGKVFSLAVDGAVYAQPLYVSNLTIGGGTHNVVFVATEQDSVYAFDADSNTGANSSFLWRASLIDTAHGASFGATPVSAPETGCDNLEPNIGITSTPVIDLATGTMYVEAKSKENGIFVHRLHALDITTGFEKYPGPIVITATVNGTGDGSSGGQLTFGGSSEQGQAIALNQLNRPGLLLLNGTVYIAFASHCDNGPYHGWLFGYDAATFTNQSVFVTTPNGGLGGIWMSGAGLAADANGNIYLATGNGTFDTDKVPATELGDSILKVAPTNGTLSLLDYFTPFNQSDLSDRDADLGSGGVLLFPDQPGSHPHELVEVGKDGIAYLVDRDQMTANNNHYCNGCTSNPQIVQELDSGLAGMWSMPAYWNNTVYFWASGDRLKAFPLNNGLLSVTPSSFSTTFFDFPGATPVVSSNGTSDGVVWAIDSSNNGIEGSSLAPAVLHAYDASNVANELYNSAQAPNNRDQAGDAVKFTVPVVVNGKVYIGTSSEVDVYGLSTCFAPSTPVGLSAAAGNTQVSLSWTASSGAVSYNVKRSTSSGGPYATTVTGIAATRYTDTGLTNGTTYFYVVSAINSCGESGNSNQASAAPSTTPPLPGTADFVTSDTSTEGSWHGVYGADGYSVANDFQSLPAYALFAVQNQLNYTWAASTADPRALQTGSGTGRIAATWYNSSTFSFDVNFIDGSTHRFALYVLDWDSNTRAETIQIVDANSNAVLDTRSISQFNNGIYLVWNISRHVKINVTRTGGANAVVSGVFFGGSSGSETVSVTPPSITLGASQQQQFAATVSGTSNQTVSWSISSVYPPTASSGNISSTGLYTAPATISLAQVTIQATSADGIAFGTATVNLTTVTVAKFVSSDTSTKGSWQGVYGADGYSVASDSQSIPRYASFAVQYQLNYTWAASTADPRALQTGSGTGRIASTWYNNTSFNFDVNFTDGNAHRFALYALDWDSNTRAETIQIVDADSNAVLDTRSISQFNNGIYLVWNISRHVKINVTRTGGANAVVSGVFFGGSSGSETVSVTPPSITLGASQQQQFAATVSGTSNQTVSWSISSVYPPTASSGNISSTGLYTAPATISLAQVTIQATSADGIAFGTATVNLTTVTVAKFVSSDTSTKGSWQGVYGADGYSVASDSQSIPRYASFAVQYQLNYTWAASTADPRALQTGSGTGRIAATWYNDLSFNFDVNFTDGNAHQFALYALDWDSNTRAETIQVVDANSNAVLDTRSISQFNNGIYLVWNISGHVKINVIRTGGANAVISGAFWGGSTGSETVSVTPQSFTLGASQQQQFAATVSGTSNQTVTWSISSVNPPTASSGNISSAGLYTAPATITAAQVTIQARSDDGTASGTATVNLTTGAIANFVSSDTSTEGSWHGVYGADGYSVANDSQSIPSYASFAVQNQQNYTWAASTTDPRALQTGNGTGRIASTWYNNTSFNFDVNFTDGGTHRFAVYALDWDSTTRTETIQIVDANSNAVLDTRNISSFNHGIYLIWNISGHVKINVTRTGGANAVISGVFLN
jgi:hypothetical protein